MCLHTNIRVYPKGLKTKLFVGYKIMHLKRSLDGSSQIVSANFRFTWKTGLNKRENSKPAEGTYSSKTYAAGIHVYKDKPSPLYTFSPILRVTYKGSDVIASGREHNKRVHVVKAVTVSPEDFKKVIEGNKP